MSTPTFWSPSSFRPSSALRAAEQRDAAAGHDALFDGRLGGVHRVLDARLLLLHLGLGGRTDLDDGDAADELRQPLLQLLAVVVRGRVLDLRADLLRRGLRWPTARRAPSTIVVLSLSIVTFFALPRSSILMFSSLMPRSSVMARPPVRIAMSSSMALRRSPKPGRLDGRDLQRAAQLVDDERRERFAIDVFRDDDERTAAARHLLEQRAAGPSSS